jgi:ankyrin repeat protein
MGGCNSKEEEFFKAVQAGEQDEVRHLAAKIETINFHEPKTGNTPLHVACLCGNTEMASFLLQLNADVNSRDAKGRSPLYVASLGGYVEVVTALLVAGAEVNARTNDGLSSAYAAAWRGRYKVLVLLVET